MKSACQCGKTIAKKQKNKQKQAFFAFLIETNAKNMQNPVFVTNPTRKLKKPFYCYFHFFEFLTPNAWCLKSGCYSQDEIPRKRFWSDEKLIKNMKRLIFIVFSSSNVCFSKAFTEKTKKWKHFSHRFLFLSVYF